MPYNIKYDTHKILYGNIGKNDKIKTQEKFKKWQKINIDIGKQEFNYEFSLKY